jgi:hypothetical protein
MSSSDDALLDQMASRDVTAPDDAERFALGLDQVGCQVAHHFGPGVYMRECRIPAGAFVVGHRHRFSHTNILLQGCMAFRQDDDPITVVRAPFLYVAKPGRKMGLAREDVVWMNVFSTTETDIDALERALFDKSPAFLDAAARLRASQAVTRELDREDFFTVLHENGFTPFDARAISENESDQIPFPPDSGHNVVIRQSAIEGRGVFVQTPAKPGDILALARIGKKRTPAGRYANHARKPNALFVEAHDGDVLLVATAHIAPYCNELSPGDEVTVDYRQALRLAWRLA